jgi:hypothetical protein
MLSGKEKMVAGQRHEAASKGSTMDSYDSDSSGFEEDDRAEFTETSVLLGFVSEDPVEDSISHLGGWPV